MTTSTNTSVLDHTSDAGFRAWGSALVAQFAAVGMVKTSDTGQINWTTVTRPGGSNTAAGYEIWRFADSSLYLKIEYGNGTTTSIPMAWVTVGTGSNGSGSLTGQQCTRSRWFYDASPTSTSTTYTTYVCHVNGAFSVLFKQNSNNTSSWPSGLLVVGKTVDSSGNPTSDGYGVLFSGVAGSYGVFFQSVRLLATATTYAGHNQYALVVGNVTSTTVGANIQTYYVWMNIPDVRPFVWANVYVVAEIPENNTFSVAMVSSANHTYLAIGVFGGLTHFSGQSAANYSFGIIYE